MPPQARADAAAAAARDSAAREVRRLIPQMSTTPGSGPEVKVGPVSAPVFPLLLMGIGGYLMWFGIHYWRSDIKWPSDPVKSFLQGKGLPDQTTATPEDAYLSAYITGAGASSSSTVSPSSAPSTSGPGQTLSQSAIEQLWTSNGGPQDTASFAAQVANAESGGRTAVTSSNPDGGTNVGIWQLDTKGVGEGYSVEQLSDPDTNARITVLATNGGTNWSEWADPVVNELTDGQYTPQLS